MINLSNKKGIEKKLVVAIIVIVISFAVILFFWSRLNPQGQTIKEICSASIQARGGASIWKFQAREAIPLKCQTEKICLTSRTGGTCPGYVSTENCPVRTIKVNNKDDILNAIADLLYEDYGMTGKGEVNFMPRKLGGETYCMITSRISLDPQSDIKNLGSIKAGDLWRILEQKKQENGVSYLKELLKIDSVSDVASISELNQLLNKPLDLSKQQMIAVKIFEKGYLLSRTTSIAAGSLVAVGAGAIAYYVAAPVTIPATIVIVGGAALKAGLITTGVTTVATLKDPDNKGISYTYTNPQLMEYSNESLDKLDCNEVGTTMC